MFNPGQTITVSVTSPANASFSQVGVVAEDPIGGSTSLATSVPAQLSITLPLAINAFRTYALTAVGATSSNQFAQSTPVLIDIEDVYRPSQLLQLDSPTPGLSFNAIGEQLPLIVIAAFPDGNVSDVTRSTYITYTSSNSSIATVDVNGMVTATGTGQTGITALYSVNGENISLFIPVNVQSVGVSSPRHFAELRHGRRRSNEPGPVGYGDKHRSRLAENPVGYYHRGFRRDR